MAITTLDGYYAAARQKFTWTKNTTRTTVATGFFTMFDLAGQPGAGTLAAGTTLTTGAVPTDATAGFPLITAFGGGNKGYLNSVAYGNTVAAWLGLYDRLWHNGAIGFAAGTTTVSSFPSISSRVPGGTDYNGLEIWLQVTTAFATGNNWSVSVSYTNQSGVAGRTATMAAAAFASLTVGRMHQLSLQAGDSGVQSIQSIVVTNGATAMTAGNFNILIMRFLWENRVQVVNGGGKDGPEMTGMIEVFDTSALDVIVAADATSSGTPSLSMTIING